MLCSVRPILTVILLLAWSQSLHSAQQGAQNAQGANPATPSRNSGSAVDTKLPDLLRGGLSRGLVQFGVPDPTGKYLWIPRLAILRKERLEIFKPVGESREVFELEFSLEKNQEVNSWDELVTFPSGYSFPGIVIYGGAETTRDEMTVVCYVGGKFKVVFQGNAGAFIDLERDGFPEIGEEHFASEDAAQPDWIKIWAWNGEKYVLAITVPGKDYCSSKALEAIHRVAANRQSAR